MSEAVTEFRERVTFAHRAQEMLKNRLCRIGGLVSIGGSGIVATASAAINFTPITELIQAVTGLIPSLMDLVIELAPLIVTIAIISFLVTFFRKNILELLNM